MEGRKEVGSEFNKVLGGQDTICNLHYCYTLTFACYYNTDYLVIWIFYNNDNMANKSFRQSNDFTSFMEKDQRKGAGDLCARENVLFTHFPISRTRRVG